jgi:hypothetical protein
VHKNGVLLLFINGLFENIIQNNQTIMGISSLKNVANKVVLSSHKNQEIFRQWMLI